MWPPLEITAGRKKTEVAFRVPDSSFSHRQEVENLRPKQHRRRRKNGVPSSSTSSLFLFDRLIVIAIKILEKTHFGRTGNGTNYSLFPWDKVGNYTPSPHRHHHIKNLINRSKVLALAVDLNDDYVCVFGGPHQTTLSTRMKRLV
jgi:hypothetical protein